ncbi:MAG: ABC transporter permease [Bacteroidota bacterium]
MASGQKITIIESGRQSFPKFLENLWGHRSLILTLARRDLKVKYAQTLLGIGWSVLQPLTGLAIFTLFFDKLIKIQTLDMAYPLFVFSGMICWFYFSYIVVAAGNSIQENTEMLKKIYFPKLILPLSKALTGLVDFIISLVLLVILMFILGRMPSWQIVFLPFIVGFIIITGLSVALLLNAATIRQRDFKHIIPYLVNFGIWLTPVFYPGTILPEEWLWVHFLNPVAAAIEGFRWSLLAGTMPDFRFCFSIIPVMILFFSGLMLFRKMEDEIADNI